MKCFETSLFKGLAGQHCKCKRRNELLTREAANLADCSNSYTIWKYLEHCLILGILNALDQATVSPGKNGAHFSLAGCVWMHTFPVLMSNFPRN